MTNDDLKKCPFCGGKAEFFFRGDERKGGYLSVRCVTCKASAGLTYYRGEPVYNWENTIGAEKVAYAWNRRESETHEED